MPRSANAQYSVSPILTSAFQVALLEWSDAVHDLITVSIHTYERAPQLVSNNKLYSACPDIYGVLDVDGFLDVSRQHASGSSIALCSALITTRCYCHPTILSDSSRPGHNGAGPQPGQVRQFDLLHRMISEKLLVETCLTHPVSSWI
jgi:hypothetical protein